MSYCPLVNKMKQCSPAYCANSLAGVLLTTTEILQVIDDDHSICSTGQHAKQQKRAFFQRIIIKPITMDLLSAFYRFDVDGVDAISMDSVHIPVMVQLQIQDPERDII